MSKKYFVGLDLSLSSTGITIIDEKGKLICLETITSEKTKSNVNFRFSRYLEIIIKIKSFIIKYTKEYKNIEIIAIESLPIYRRGGVLNLFELGSLVRYYLYKNKILMIEISPMTLKKFVNGNASGMDKNIICKEVFKNFKVDVNTNDEADSFLLALFGMLYYRFKVRKYTDIILSKYKKYRYDIVKKFVEKEREVLKKDLKNIKK